MSDKRAKNFTSFEKNLLIDLVLERKDILENKKTNGASSAAEKEKSWEDLCKSFNACNQSGERTEKQLKELYFVLKRKARKNNNEDRIGYSQTGGGTYMPKSDETDAKLISKLKSQFEPDNNPFDSSANIFGDRPNTSTSTSKERNFVLLEINDSTIINLENIENVESVNIVADFQSPSMPVSSQSKQGYKRKTNSYLETISDAVVSRKKCKGIVEEKIGEKKCAKLEDELLIKRSELHMKEKEHEKRCEILDIEKKTKKYKLKIMQLAYKMKLREF